MQELTDAQSLEGWTEIPYKTHNRQPIPGLLYIPNQNTSHRPFNTYNHNNHTNRTYYQNSSGPKPVSHYWNGFTCSGDEKWVIELENGSLITNKEPSYAHLVKRYFPNDIIR